jgi:hypothetical protein
LIASVPSLQQTKSGLRPASQSQSGLPLQPTDLPLLLTEQIAHMRPLPIVFAWEIAREAKTPQTGHAASASPGTMLSSAQINGHIGHVG